LITEAPIHSTTTKELPNESLAPTAEFVVNDYAPRPVLEIHNVPRYPLSINLDDTGPPVLIPDLYHLHHVQYSALVCSYIDCSIHSNWRPAADILQLRTTDVLPQESNCATTCNNTPPNSIASYLTAINISEIEDGVSNLETYLQQYEQPDRHMPGIPGRDVIGALLSPELLQILDTL